MMNHIIHTISSPKSLIILGIGFIICFFTVPYLLPPEEIVTSMSYDYGFNNFVGIILVCLSILVFGFIGYMRNDLELILFEKETEKLSPRYFWYGASVLMLFFFWSSLCGEWILCMPDCSYFLCHIYEMLYGKIPYKDFAFGYGPLTIYLPYYIYKLIPFISIINAYIISVALFHIFGIWCFYEIVNSTNVGKKTKIYLYVLGYFAFFPFGLGMNYQILRFILPFWALLRCHQMSTKLRLIYSPLTVVLVLALSPEVGLVYLIAMISYCVFLYYVSRSRLYVAILILTLLFSFYFIGAHLPMFILMQSFGSGFYNFPFIPSFHLIVFFICIFLVAYYVGGAFLQLERFVLEISFVLLAFGLLPVCLGRCDPGHVVFNGFFIFYIAIVSLENKSRYTKNLFCVLLSFVVVIVFSWNIKVVDVLAPIYNNIDKIYVYRGNLTKSIGNKIEKIYSLYSKKSSMSPPTPTESCFDAKVAMPIVTIGDRKLYFEALTNGKLQNLFFSFTTSLGTSNVNKTVEELKEKKPVYILSRLEMDNYVKPVPYERYNFYIHSLFHSYFSLKPYRNGNIVNKPLVDYIMQNYEMVNYNKSYIVYKIKKSHSL